MATAFFWRSPGEMSVSVAILSAECRTCPTSRRVVLFSVVFMRIWSIPQPNQVNSTRPKTRKADIVMNPGRINSGMGRFPSSWLKSMAVDDIISLRCALVQRGLTPISLNWTNSVFYSVFIKYALKYNTVVVSCLWFSCFCTSITEVNSLYCVATEIPFAP